MTHSYIAIDLGAESGRIVVASLDGDKLELMEIHRFPNGTIQLPTGLHWNLTNLWREICSGLEIAGRWAKANDKIIRSIGVDTWGVDWGLIGDSGELIGLPHAYRDPRNIPAFEDAIQKISPGDIYELTGIQIMPINTLFSLHAMNLTSPEVVRSANQLLFMPDLLNFFLTGIRAVEATIASTSQIIDVTTGQWCIELLDKLGIPKSLFKPTISPGTHVGPITDRVAEATGLGQEVQVVATASHDTASAVAAVPASDEDQWCFISSGTWSLLGVELDQPCLTQKARDAMFTNERGVGGTIRFLKNISGLWLVQQCRVDFARRQQDYTYNDLTELAELAQPFRTLLNPDHAAFAQPGDMLEKIQQFAIDTEQPVPETPGDYLRCCLESLALAYRQTLQIMESVLELRCDVIHIVGGGAQNKLLNRMTADATGRRVIAGPFEATAIGNALIQSMGLGHIKDLRELRQIVRSSFEPEVFDPADANDSGEWQDAITRFRSFLETK